MKNLQTIKLKDGSEFRIRFKGLPEDFDVDRILRIDYNNLEAEIATLPILMNSIGMILAELDNNVRLSELELKKTKATVAEEGREEITAEKNGRAATNDETLEYVRRSVKYDAMNRKLSTAIYKRDIINSIYWSIKSKQEILQNLSRTMNSVDFQDNLIGSNIKEMNYVSLNKREPLIK